MDPSSDSGTAKPLRGGEAWSIDFSAPKMKRKTTNKERAAIVASRIRNTTRQLESQQNEHLPHSPQLKGDDSTVRVGCVADSENNRHLQILSVDGMEDVAALIPRNLPTERADLEQRLCFRIPRLLCTTKQYPKSCGISSLTSVWNYLYSRIGEASVGATRAPVSQEELMSILGFAPPFDTISWGPFTGNGTLLRWFHAINRHFGVTGRAYMLYKPQGRGRTNQSQEEALLEVKKILRDPHAAIIYHCHNHYMVPIGYQEIPRAQSDFYAKNVSSSDCDTTVFIAEVSRGRHDALYAKKWSEIVKDLMCRSPNFYNIRLPEKGIQTRASKKTPIQDETAQERTEAVAVNPFTASQSPKDAEVELSATIEITPPTTDATTTTTTAAPIPGVALQVLTDEVGTTELPTTTTTTERKTRRKVKSGGGNVHCLLCFRSDEVEEHPERFEVSSSSSSSSSSDSSSSGSRSDDEVAVVEE